MAIAGAFLGVAGAVGEGMAAGVAGDINAMNLEFEGELAEKRAAEDEQMFRLSFARDEASNVAAVAASGIRLEGSPLDALRDNARMAEADAINIRRGGAAERSRFQRQAAGERRAGRAARRAGDIRGAAVGFSAASKMIQSGSVF